jgi:hypothetical protein
VEEFKMNPSEAVIGDIIHFPIWGVWDDEEISTITEKYIMATHLASGTSVRYNKTHKSVKTGSSVDVQSYSFINSPGINLTARERRINAWKNMKQ